MTGAIVLGWTGLLHDLIALNGRTVSVIATARNGHGVLATSGVLVGATEVGGEIGSDEALYFPLDQGPYHGSSAFLVTRASFERASWVGGALHVELGQITLLIEPDHDDEPDDYDDE